MALSLLDLVEQQVSLKRAAAGELAGPCPGCGGEDRFRVWPEKGRYYCRGCDAKGDDIQFCRDFLNLSYSEACQVVGKDHQLNERERREISRFFPLPNKSKQKVNPVSERVLPNRAHWERESNRFIEYANAQLLNRPDLLDWLQADRGLSRATVERWKLGYNPTDQRLQADLWGFAPEDKPVFISAGIVIPYLLPGGSIAGINVRRFKPTDSVPGQLKTEQRPDPPYLRVRGTQSKPWILTDGQADTEGLPTLLVESELDALLLWQELGTVAVPVALLTAGAKPGPLPGRKGPLLWALDRDEAGRKGFAAWATLLPGQVYKAPPIRGKDVTEMHLAGVKLSVWFKAVMQSEGL